MLLLQASKKPENRYAGGAEKKSDERGGHRSAFEIIGMAHNDDPNWRFAEHASSSNVPADQLVSGGLRVLASGSPVT